MNESVGTVLLVDDDADARTTLSMLLSSYGVKVIEVASGAEALERLAVSLPSLVLLDFDMPGLDGVETLKRVREKFSEAELPVVMVSNRQDADTIVEALEQGANDYVFKSSDPAVLQARIRRHLIHRRLPDDEERPFGGMIGPYRLQRELGESPMAATYRAVDTRDETGRAIRILKPGFQVDTVRFESWGSFRHPLLADLLDVGNEPVDYFVYQLVEGPSLEEYVGEKGALSPQEALGYAFTLARAVEAVHETGRVHGELRPSNLRLTEAGPVLLDFGFSELIVKEDPLTRNHQAYGHPSYLAPEALNREVASSPGADIYGVGAVLFTLATGRLPFDGGMAQVLHQVLHDKPPKPSSLRQDGDRVFDFVCGRLMSKKPEHRYSCIADVVQKLRELCEEKATPL
jgi:serine/threonine protein kinase